MEQKTAVVIFQPSGRRGKVPFGITLVEASRLLGVDIEAPCGEHQVCGKCKVRIENGLFEKFAIHSSPDHAGPFEAAEDEILSKEEKRDGCRLGCIATVQGDLLIYVPESSRAGKQVVSKAAREIDIELDPGVKQYTIKMEPPTLEDGLADFERVCQALAKDYGLSSLEIDIYALRSLSNALRSGDWEITVSVWMDKEIIRVRPGSECIGYGFAIDIGTTTIAGYLCDLETGEVVDTLSMMNPQVKYGEDVVSRISYHMGNPDGLARMSSDVIEAINGLIDKAVAGSSTDDESDQGRSASPSIREEDIIDVAICSNTAMHHILLQLDPEPLGSIPFTPAIHHSISLKCRDLGIKTHPAANVLFLPSIAGYVGGDTIGVMLAEMPHKQKSTQLIIDIGTNGELVLGNSEKLLCSSCATGPALEGAQIEFGMRAAPGAIERVKIDPVTHEVDYKVIGRKVWKSYSAPEDMKTRGICGSGILDVVGELFLAGIVAKGGAFSPKAHETRRFRKNQETGFSEFVLAWAEETSIGTDIVINQKDIRQIQMAKASIYTGCKLMMRRLGITALDSIKIAGAFGTHIDRHLARVIGLIPDCLLETVISVGNAAGDGCRAALLNREKRKEADQLWRLVNYIELTMEENFQGELVAATQLPHMVDEFVHLDEIS
ncbi:MAG: ferredoxin [Desulfobulbaceae bacterium C00003063]|nr:MAG: ferredoxin [Desulfobulbaceae bacterium C00003063]